MILEAVLVPVLLFLMAQIVRLATLVKQLERRQDRMLTKMGWRITDI